VNKSPNGWAKIEADGGKLTGNISSQPITLTPVEPWKFLAEGRLLDAAVIQFERDPGGKVVAFTAMGQKFSRIDPSAVPDTPPLWTEFTGNYGPAFIPLVVSLRHGHLYALIENELDYRLIPASRHVFVCPPGMYRAEHVVFLTGPEGKVHGVRIANMYLRRQS